MMVKKHLLFASLAIALFTLTSRPASADSITLQLTTANSAISGFAGPYANVTVNLTTSTTATITFAGLTATDGTNNYQYLFGGQGAVALNVNASSFGVGTVTGTNSGTGFTPGALAPTTSGKNPPAGSEDGFGNFNLSIDSFDGFGHSSDTVTFVLTDTSGSWANASSVLTANSNGGLAAAHIFVTTSPANAGNNGGMAINTGYASTGGATLPDGGLTISLLGLALGGLGFIARRNN
jgi:hypothetical protein